MLCKQLVLMVINEQLLLQSQLLYLFLPAWLQSCPKVRLCVTCPILVTWQVCGVFITHVLKQMFTRFYWCPIPISLILDFKTSKDFSKSMQDLKTVGDTLDQSEVALLHVLLCQKRSIQPLIRCSDQLQAAQL